MNILRNGSRGPQVQLLQLALARAGYSPGKTDGIFGFRTESALMRFQRARGLSADGIAGSKTHAALYPWYTGYIRRTLRPGDSLYRLAESNGTTVRAIEAANPGLDPLRLNVGAQLTIPLGFSVVPADISYCSELIRFCCVGLGARYPFISLGELGQSVMGRPLYSLTLGSGPNLAFFNAAHHANEWITAPLLLRYCEDLASAYVFDQPIYGRIAGELLEKAALCLAPAVNPDGIDLVTGDLTSGPYFQKAAAIAAAYPGIPFPEGWKANILGTDLNLQYPAGWAMAREIKFAQGFVTPAPRDYVGPGPLTAPESLNAYYYTLDSSPVLTLSYHSQGNTIFWRYLDYEPEGSLELAEDLARASGYALSDTPYASGFAGYKDWFIQDFNRPGYTIEVGLGENPLPISQFDEIYRDNLGLLTVALEAAGDL